MCSYAERSTKSYCVGDKYVIMKPRIQEDEMNEMEK